MAEQPHPSQRRRTPHRRRLPGPSLRTCCTYIDLIAPSNPPFHTERLISNRDEIQTRMSLRPLTSHLLLAPSFVVSLRSCFVSTASSGLAVAGTLRPQSPPPRTSSWTYTSPPAQTSSEVRPSRLPLLVTPSAPKIMAFPRHFSFPSSPLPSSLSLLFCSGGPRVGRVLPRPVSRGVWAGAASASTRALPPPPQPALLVLSQGVAIMRS